MSSKNVQEHGEYERGFLEGIEYMKKTAAAIAMEQEFFPDTEIGTRQGWVKAEIARKITNYPAA